MPGGSPREIPEGQFPENLSKFQVQKSLKNQHTTLEQHCRFVGQAYTWVAIKFSALEMAWKAIFKPFLDFMGGSPPHGMLIFSLFPCFPWGGHPGTIKSKLNLSKLRGRSIYHALFEVSSSEIFLKFCDKFSLLEKQQIQEGPPLRLPHGQIASCPNLTGGALKPVMR